MYLTGSKVIAILCIIATIPTKVVITIKQPIVNSSFELKAFKDFLDYNHLKHAIIVYTPSCITSLSSASSTTVSQKGCANIIKDNFMNSYLLQHLTESYHMQFFNTLLKINFEKLFYYQSPKVGVFMKYSANDESKKNLLHLASLQQRFNNSFAWFVVVDDYKNSMFNIFGHLNVMLNADVTVAFHHDNLTLNLYDVYKICHYCGFSLEIAHKGIWSVLEGFKLLPIFQYGIVLRKNDLKGVSINAATAISNKSPDINLTDLEYLNDNKYHMEADTMQRKTYQLVKFMEPLYNITFKVDFSHRTESFEVGNWDEAVKLLESSKVELSLYPLRFVAERLRVLTYSPNIHTEKIYFLLRHPKHLSNHNMFLEPLAVIVWFCILALIVITILLLVIHVHIEYKLYWIVKGQQYIAGGGDLVVENKFDFIAFCIMETILMQGPSPELFYYNSTRLLILSLSVFSIVLMQFYGAFIVSKLLMPAPRTITNLAALYNSSLEIGMENVSYNYDVFINTKNPLEQNVYKYRICNKHNNRNNIISLQEGVNRIGRGNFAFHVAVDRAYRLLKNFLTESQFCDLQEINFYPPFTFASALGIRKSSPYYEYITAAINMFRESGLLKHNDKKWEVDKIDCSAVQVDEMYVDLKHFAPALVFLAVAILTSLVVFFIEIVYKKIENKKLYTKQNM